MEEASPRNEKCSSDNCDGGPSRRNVNTSNTSTSDMETDEVIFNDDSVNGSLLLQIASYLTFLIAFFVVKYCQ
jgi:hypothetical protein